MITHNFRRLAHTVLSGVLISSCVSLQADIFDLFEQRTDEIEKQYGITLPKDLRNLRMLQEDDLTQEILDKVPQILYPLTIIKNNKPISFEIRQSVYKFFQGQNNQNWQDFCDGKYSLMINTAKEQEIFVLTGNEVPFLIGPLMLEPVLLLLLINEEAARSNTKSIFETIASKYPSTITADELRDIFYNLPAMIQKHIQTKCA